jgi:hypothetical protein
MMDRQALHEALTFLLAQVRWTPVPQADDAAQDPTQPYATHEGILDLPGLGCVPCYRLNTGEPVFDLEVLEQLLGLAATGEDGYLSPGEHGREA